MRLGGPIPQNEYHDPSSWLQALRSRGYRAAYCPVSLDASNAEIDSYATAAAEADIVIAEVGAWSNPISPDEIIRQAALEKCKRSLALADRIGAWNCVNIAGSRGEKWDGPHPDNLTQATFDLIVETVREIIDAVKPDRSACALETMPWVFPDSPDSYQRLIQAIDRRAFGVHLDPVNMISSVQLYFNNSALIRECFARLGAQIRSCHAKDILLRQQLTVHLDEVRPGLGSLDYVTFLSELDQLHPDTPVMLEHLPSQEEYGLAAEYLRSVARQLKLQL